MKKVKSQTCAVPMLVSVILICSLAGCSRGPTILPDDDPVCGVFPNSTLAAMLPGGTYHYVIPNTQIEYYSSSVSASGGCALANSDPEIGQLYVHIDGNFIYNGGTGSTSTILSKTCHDGDLENLSTPTVGIILGTGSCVTDRTSSTAGAGAKVWALYWGGHYSGVGTWPDIIVINAIIYPGKSHRPADSIPDATNLVQTVLDFITTSYQADPSAATDPTAAPDATHAPPTSGPT